MYFNLDLIADDLAKQSWAFWPVGHTDGNTAMPGDQTPIDGDPRPSLATFKGGFTKNNYVARQWAVGHDRTTYQHHFRGTNGAFFKENPNPNLE